MNEFKLITSSDGTQHATAADDGIRYDVYIIGASEPLNYKVIERATAAATEADDITTAAKDSLTADGVKLNGIDVIVTADEAKASSTQPQPYSLNGVAIELINEHAEAIADILKEYQRNTSSTSIAAHSDAIRNITKVLHNRLNTI